jgi:cobalt/nickel transport system permease protein
MMLHLVDACAHTNRWRTKSGPVALFCGGLMVCVLLAPPRTAGPLVWVVATAAALAGAQVPAGLYFRMMAVPLAFLAMSALALCVTVSFADGAFSVGFTADGARTAVDAGLRAAGAVAVTLCFACLVSCAQWIALLRRAHVPDPLLDMLQLVYRTIFVLDAQRIAIVRAQDNRLGFRTTRVALRSAARAFAALFVRSLQRAAQLERGLAARGYTNRLPVLQPRSTATRRDYEAALAIPAAMAVAAVLLDGAWRP